MRLEFDDAVVGRIGWSNALPRCAPDRMTVLVSPLAVSLQATAHYAPRPPRLGELVQHFRMPRT